MAPVTANLLRLQKDPSSIRNICILAHVDHGKTTLSDSLLSTNGIISSRMAGKVRYLDSRPDEQLRGITMESSVISLYFKLLKRSHSDNTESLLEHLINLIDSPGHIDFSSEVSVASRLCDGALVLVDVVEGVHSQTINVLRQAWTDKLRPVLVLNKIDRLITELQMSPAEAYTHLEKLVEQANVVLGGFYAADRMRADEQYREQLEKGGSAEYVEKDDSDIYFQPKKNNVVFASAYDGWGFTIGQWAAIYEKKLGAKKEKLQNVLWGNYYFDPKNKKVTDSKGLKNKRLEPMFVSLILKNIWLIYENTGENRDPEKLGKIVSALGLKVLPRDLRSKDSKTLVRTIMSQWLPVASAVLVTVVSQMDSPVVAQAVRIPSILSQTTAQKADSLLKQAMEKCDQAGPVCCYVSKMISVPESELPAERLEKSADEIAELGRIAREKARKVAEQAQALEGEKKSLANEFDSLSVNKLSAFDDFEDFDDFDFDTEAKPIEVPNEALIGIVRIYLGTVEVGSKLTVFSPKYDPANPDPAHISEVEVEDLFLIMGRELVRVQEAPAGNIVGIGGLAGKLHKTGTLVESSILNSDKSNGINLSAIASAMEFPPIVEVALEPENPLYLDQLSDGLQKLSESDPVVQTYVNDRGENILCCSGELHLERCLKDLKERFAGIEISVSEPIIPYRETIVGPDRLLKVEENAVYEGFGSKEMEPMKNEELGRGRVAIQLDGEDGVQMTISVKPLPLSITSCLLKNKVLVDNAVNGDSAALIKKLDEDYFGELSEDEIKTQVSKCKDDFYSVEKTSVLEGIVGLGPKRTGPNMLVDLTGRIKRLGNHQAKRESPILFENSLMTAFQLATMEGPLAAEPMEGVCVFIEEVKDEANAESAAAMAGKVLLKTKAAIHQGFLDWSPRIMLAVYLCDIQATSEVLGKVYSEIQKRRGKIISEEMKEGTMLFEIKAIIPVIEAFGFSDEFRKKTSGAAIPQLVFSGFQMVNEDPFWVPKTEEELEALGEKAERENFARKVVNKVRKGKGLFVDEVTVKNAEKQRTLRRD